MDNPDIQAIVNATINASSGKLNKLKDTQKNNDTIIAADSSVRDKIEAARVAYSKVTAAASAQTPNVDDITQAFNTFVSSMNDLNTAAKAGSKEAKDAVFSIKLSLSGAKSGSDGFTALAQLGYSTNRDGSISFDETKLRDKFNESSTATTDLLKKVGTDFNSAESTAASYSSPLWQKMDSLRTQNRNLDKRIQTEQAYLDRKSEILYREYSKMDQAVASLNALSQNFNRLG